ncbi:MAG: type II toxin-antitoxin system PrlF family antitoxin [Thermotogae bacterium]|jgi:AbrB family looped-hinge helix DNA binding protein|nr:type II toxin-antitoxin system PrlF family antitoxin [Thermotogota bacterium]
MPKNLNISRITRKGQVTIPNSIRKSLNISPNDVAEFKIVNGKIYLTIRPSNLSMLEKNFGKVKPLTRPENFKEIRKDFEEKAGNEAEKEMKG